MINNISDYISLVKKNNYHIKYPDHFFAALSCSHAFFLIFNVAMNATIQFSNDF